jgi:hypothetical protein
MDNGIAINKSHQHKRNCPQQNKNRIHFLTFPPPNDPTLFIKRHIAMTKKIIVITIKLVKTIIKIFCIISIIYILLILKFRHFWQHSSKYSLTLPSRFAMQKRAKSSSINFTSLEALPYNLLHFAKCSALSTGFSTARQKTFPRPSSSITSAYTRALPQLGQRL